MENAMFTHSFRRGNIQPLVDGSKKSRKVLVVDVADLALFVTPGVADMSQRILYGFETFKHFRLASSDGKKCLSIF
jgi:hypothetical protein